MHKAIIAKIQTSPHPNADRLQVGIVCNETVVCGLDVPNETLGVYFPCELQLSEEFAVVNDLIRRKNPDGSPAGGMFDPNRRVRCQTIRGVKSNGFWIELKALTKMGGDPSKLKEGDMIDKWAGKPLCNKYIPKGVGRGTGRNKGKIKTQGKYSYVFPEHKDTDQFRYFIKNIKVGDKIVVSSKLHGSSQRVARNYEIRPLKWWEKIINKFVPIDNKKVTILNGTRRVVLNNKGSNGGGFHPEKMREKAAARITPYLEDFMQVYFEVVGWENESTTIMPAHSLDKTNDKEAKKLYKDPILYTYGCPQGEFDVYVYRIAYVLPDGKTVDMPWDNVVKWCNHHKIKYVPFVDRFTFDGDYDNLLKKVEFLASGPDPIDPRHPKEGVCVRIDGIEWKCYKEKNWLFKVLEGIAKENDSYSDMEENQDLA